MGQVRIQVVLVLEEGRMRHCHLLGKRCGGDPMRRFQILDIAAFNRVPAGLRLDFRKNI